MQQEKDSIIVSNVDTVDAVREWRLKTFGKTLLYCLIPLTVPLIACFLICKVGQMAIVTTGLLLTFILSLFLARRKRLAFSVNLAIIGSSITNLYYLLNLNITDGYYFTVFMIIIAGVFLGIRAAFIWAVIQASLLITIAYFSPEYTVFQDLPIYFGKQPVSGNQKLYFSTFIMLFIVSAFISILFERYVTDLINTVKKTHDEKVILESELFQAQKLESIGLLAGGIAHDFNKGLQSIGSCANLILDNFRDHHQDLTRYARNIHDSCAMISESTRKLLDFTRRGREERANINMHEAIETMVNLLSFMLNKKITIRTELSAQQCTINGIYSQLQCMLMNLAVNASDAMAGGGVLTFSTHDSRAKYLEIRVSDTGAGMDDFIKAKLFTPFFTTKPQGKGTGLGLSIVKRIVEAHQGAIEVTGEKEKGATFSIFLPLAKKPSF